MSIEKVREEYEAWVLREYPNQHMGRFATGEYHSTVIEDCWQAWQASREAPVIELPKDIKSMAGPLMYADDVRESVAAAGISWAVKP
ncbi:MULTISPECIES: hypothetical protein [Pseudomonas syringae group]|uniref:Uncharacterized protein n=2 Tax=Pseudomonas syringae group TaxID=136849 RepID=A0AAW4DQG9_PSESX|nr:MULTISPECIES: hypothetical protein [Pseudomonas syringae group]EEB61258.1 hypothetical protein PSPTOT1_3753 [Pseudomonas syringae pv. tomato T1]KGK96174.1 hypothetical protein NB04_06835 [Pseudomonas syringae pv. tomato]KUR47654.1 hypothetical protein PSTA9_01507 [Pseudomonas syringae pv. tomato]KUR48059.1 hypothetical protein PST407_02318 [Pseudomonas syringae pv. tomato]MBI6711648.1 hypothetical protein [Pseudomonas syringae]